VTQIVTKTHKTQQKRSPQTHGEHDGTPKTFQLGLELRTGMEKDRKG